jgi:hypothetical protein
MFQNLIYHIIYLSASHKGLKNFMRHWHWFQFVLNGVLALFCGIMLYVVLIAYTRQSGSTGLDMATIQKTRYDALPRNSTSSLPPLMP